MNRKSYELLIGIFSVVVVLVSLVSITSYSIQWWTTIVFGGLIVGMLVGLYINDRKQSELNLIYSVGFPSITYNDNDKNALSSILVIEPKQTYNSRFKKAHKSTNAEILDYNKAIESFAKELNLKILNLVKEKKLINCDIGCLSVIGNRVRYFNKKVYRTRANPLSLQVKDNLLLFENESAIECNNSDEANKLKLSILNAIDLVELQRLNEWYNLISERYEKETNNVINDVKRCILIEDYEPPKKSEPYISVYQVYR